MRAIHRQEEQPWLRYLILPLALILFGLFVSYAILAWQKQPDTNIVQPTSPIPTPTPTPTPSKYACPAGGWVNCMPILTPEAAKDCTPEALNWFKKNCPDFQGVAQ